MLAHDNNEALNKFVELVLWERIRENVCVLFHRINVVQEKFPRRDVVPDVMSTNFYMLVSFRELLVSDEGYFRSVLNSQDRNNN